MKAATKFAFSALTVLLALVLVHIAWLPTYGQQTDRAKALGKRLMCMCGCNQVLTSCNHVGCTMSAAMLKQLDQVVARNEPDDLTLQSFVQEYSERVLAEPPAKGFNRVAWFIPGAAFGLGFVIVLVVISRWRRVAAVPAAPQVPPEVLARAREQIGRETED